MSYAIVFSSKTGNTGLLADTLHSCLPQADCCYFGNPNSAAMEADTLYVGFWTDKGKADESSSDFLKFRIDSAPQKIPQKRFARNGKYDFSSGFSMTSIQVLSTQATVHKVQSTAGK